MSDYLPSFIVEPVLRQARRISRLSTGEESPGFLPAVPESLRTWYPTRFWNSSPPPSLSEDEHQESTLQQIARNIQIWTNQIPSPPLDPTSLADSRPQEDPAPIASDVITTEFPPLDSQAMQQPLERQTPQASRTASDISVNPSRELHQRSLVFEDGARGHVHSDPVTMVTRRSTIEGAVPTDVAGGLQGSQDVHTRRSDGSVPLPEDDGMGPLRQRINAIWSGDGTPSDKSRLVHTIMTERYRMARAHLYVSSSPSTKPVERSNTPMSVVWGASQEAVFNLTPGDLVPTYAPIDPDELMDLDSPEASRPEASLGCAHYKRNVKMQCNDCERWYTCRICHDEAEDHTLPRRETKHMLCMLCNTPQTASQICKMCSAMAACYYCAVCKLWNDDPRKAIYHCDDCGICRLGQGLGKDFFHCQTCAVCMAIEVESTHKCIERSTKCDCPICGEYLFTSPKSVVFMRCGHSIHENCFKDWCHTSYRCPICSKSIANMESQFRRLDRHIAEQPMPDEYQDTRAYVYCNDCSSRSTTTFHWLGLKCELCESYNTTQLELIGNAQPPNIGIADEAINTIEPMVASTNNISDEAVPIPTSRAASRRQSTIQPLTPTVAESLRLTTTSPPAPSPRPISPSSGGNYFGTADTRRESVQSLPQRQIPSEITIPRRGTTPLDDDEDLDFWGGQSPTSPAHLRDLVDPSADEDEDELSSSSSDEPIDDDDCDEEDVEDRMAIFGHR